MTPAQNTAAYVSGFEDGKRVAIAEIKRELDAQTQRTWVGLTVEDVHDCLKGLPTQSIEVYARSVEAKLKQKNGYAEEKNT